MGRPDVGVITFAAAENGCEEIVDIGAAIEKDKKFFGFADLVVETFHKQLFPYVSG
jgi:hypothetical protein